jgi:hypothetical protein
MTALLDRPPTGSERFQAMVAALERLNGRCDQTADAIQAELAADAPDFGRAALAIGCRTDDLVDAYCDEMLARGFFVRRGLPQ